MKRLHFFILCILFCTYCGPYTTKVSAQTHQKYLESTTHEERAARRAARLEEFEKYIDSLVLSRNFEFNPQTMQQLPAGTMRLISNALYNVTLWRGTMDVCLPYIAGFTPPYRYVLLNTGSPSLNDMKVQQTEGGWVVSFKTNLYASMIYTFTFEISSRYGGANLTISNNCYSPVQYSGRITKIF